MEFDKSKVFTAVNADELKPGSKVIVAYNLQALKEQVAKIDTVILQIIEDIIEEGYEYRFRLKGVNNLFPLAYLVSEPETLKWTDLKLGDKIRKSMNNGDYYRLALVTRIDTYPCNNHIEIGGEWLKDEDLAGWEKINEND